SSLFAFGIKSCNSSIRCYFDNISCWIKYFVKGTFFAPVANIVKTLFGSTDSNMSIFEPVFQNVDENPANGPNNNVFLLSIYRVSRCGTDIGGAPTAALPYTLASCCSTTSGLLHTKNSPLTGKPPICLLSGIPVFC